MDLKDFQHLKSSHAVLFLIYFDETLRTPTREIFYSNCAFFSPKLLITVFRDILKLNVSLKNDNTCELAKLSIILYTMDLV